MDHCKRRLGEDSDDYNYYRKLFEKGYVYISVDGNNRTKCVRRFIDNEFSLIKLPVLQAGLLTYNTSVLFRYFVLFPFPLIIFAYS